MKKLLWLAAVLAALVPSLFAGDGKINANGTVDLTVDFRFAPTQAELDLTKQRLTDFSAKLWDASEGQLRLGKIKLGCGTVDEDLADIWIQQQIVQYASQIGSLGQPGAHFNHPMVHDGSVMFHEFGHYALFLGDEYPLGPGGCGSSGHCMDVITNLECIMEDQAPPFDNEFCVPQNHDPLKGNNPGCANDPQFGGAPCLQFCEEWNPATKQYEVSNQEHTNHKSCWETIVEHYPFMVMPAGLPEADPPAGFIAPQFDDVCTAASVFVLALDKSGSMGQPVNAESGEICGNNKDDDGNGQVDELGCSKTRIDFVHAAARQLMDAALGSGARIGIVAFETHPQTVSPVVILDPNIVSLENATDALTPGALTAIGEALQASKQLIDTDAAPAAAKAVVIVTDGKNTAGIDPAQPVPDYVAAGIRIFPVATGTAVDDPTLAAIANKTNGVQFSSPKPSQMLAAANEAWTQWRGESPLIARTPWTASGPAAKPLQSFVVDKATRSIAVALMSEMTDTRRLGVRLRLVDPNGKVFDTAAASPPQMRVTSDPFFLRVTIAAPVAGKWTMSVQRTSRGAARQNGSYAVTSSVPAGRLFASNDRSAVRIGEAVTMTLRPERGNPLRRLQWNVRVRRPDGSIVSVTPVEQRMRGVYTLALRGLDVPGTYAVTASFTTTRDTVTVPGERERIVRDGRVTFGRTPQPQHVPAMQRSVTRYVVVSR